MRRGLIASGAIVAIVGAGVFGVVQDSVYKSLNPDCLPAPPPGLRPPPPGGLLGSPTLRDLMMRGWKQGSVAQAKRLIPGIRIPRTALANRGTLRRILLAPGDRHVGLWFGNGITVDVDPSKSPFFRRTFVRSFLAETAGASCGIASSDVSWIAVAPGYQSGMGGEKMPRPGLFEYYDDRFAIVAGTYRYSAPQLASIVRSMIRPSGFRRGP